MRTPAISAAATGAWGSAYSLAKCSESFPARARRYSYRSGEARVVGLARHAKPLPLSFG
jgi:hypothetical protein